MNDDAQEIYRDEYDGIITRAVISFFELIGT